MQPFSGIRAAWPRCSSPRCGNDSPTTACAPCWCCSWSPRCPRGGFGIDDKTATAIYGLYTAGVYLAALPGGWIADRLIGAQRAVLVGGHRHHARQCAARGLDQPARVLSRPGRDRARRRTAEAQRQRHGRGPLSGGRRAARCRVYGVLHGHQCGRDVSDPSSPARRSNISACARASPRRRVFMAVGVLQYYSRSAISETPANSSHPPRDRGRAAHPLAASVARAGIVHARAGGGAASVGFR